jgi:genome maintenance exonuclease 1
MTFNHIKLSELDFDLEAVTTESGRQYKTPNGNSYPSVTTVLSSYNKKAIYEWRARVGDEEANKVSGKASRRGTALHSVCEKYLLNEMNELRMHTMMPNIKELFLQLRPELDRNIGKIYSLEQALYSDGLKIAGRVDCIAEWDGELAVIDFKTSSKEKWEDGILNYFMQCSAYAEMFGEITGKPINKLVVAIAVEEGKPQIFVRDKEPYLPQLKQYIAKYYLTNN